MTARPDLPVIGMLPDGRRLNLRHGPIDLIVEATGTPGNVAAAYRRAAAAFPGILGGLVNELALLRTPITTRSMRPTGPIAQAMDKAARTHAAGAYVTPMICVAGAVADHVLAIMTRACDLDRAYVNNGGDIALYLGAGQSFDVGVCANPQTGELASVARIAAGDGVGGIATSGWRGRSHSLGIADAVTTLAPTAAGADAAATLIANAVDLPGHKGIARAPANTLSPDSDLGTQPVTTQVPSLCHRDMSRALDAGRALASEMIARGHIIAAYGSLQGLAFSAAAPQDRDATPGLPAPSFRRSEVTAHA